MSEQSTRLTTLSWTNTYIAALGLLMARTFPVIAYELYISPPLGCLMANGHPAHRLYRFFTWVPACTCTAASPIFPAYSQQLQNFLIHQH